MANITIKEVIKQPIVIISLLITFIWLLTDINSRLLAGNAKSIQNNGGQSLKALPAMVLTSAELDFITQQYQHFKRDEDTNEQTEQQLTAEQQLAQQGLMQQVFINDNKLTLKAVIHERNTTASKSKAMLAYALINQTNLKTAESELIKVFNNQEIKGFTLTILSSTQVELARTHEQGEQRITLTMYRVADKIK
ncbi:hypothetical protein [Pseudoalteromonas distincta]|uniref:hypothetical protein n=1 Tax=Pseudoalteromonas distincta TaxID=77608 RepID=UPI0032E088D1